MRLENISVIKILGEMFVVLRQNTAYFKGTYICQPPSETDHINLNW